MISRLPLSSLTYPHLPSFSPTFLGFYFLIFSYLPPYSLTFLYLPSHSLTFHHFLLTFPQPLSQAPILALTFPHLLSPSTAFPQLSSPSITTIIILSHIFPFNPYAHIYIYPFHFVTYPFFLVSFNPKILPPRNQNLPHLTTLQSQPPGPSLYTQDNH